MTRTVLNGLLRTSGAVNGLLARIAAVALLIIVLIICGNIAVRTVSSPLNGTYELVSMAAVVVFGLSIGYAHTRGAHASIDLVVARWPRRARIVLGGMVSAASAALFVQVAVSVVVYSGTQREQGSATEVLGIPTWPAALLVAFGMAALALALIADAAKGVLAWSSDDAHLNIF